MLRKARKTIFWPGMTAEIKQIANYCTACQESKPRNQKETLMQHNKGATPWEKAATDIFHIKGHDYIVLVDYLSNFIEVDYLPTITSKTVINKLKAQFARYGVPKILVSDCGAHYASAEFQQFSENWGFTHETSAPGHHQANGKAESAVNIIKTDKKMFRPVRGSTRTEKYTKTGWPEPSRKSLQTRTKNPFTQGQREPKP